MLSRLEDGTYQRTIAGGNRLSQEPDSDRTTRSKVGGLTRRIVAGEDVTYSYDRAEALARGIIRVIYPG